MKPQTAAIYKHLCDVGTITNVEAQAVYKSRSLTKRISELKVLGYDIKSEWKRDHTGQRYVRYWLRKKTPNEVLPNAEFLPAPHYHDSLRLFLEGVSTVVSNMFVWVGTPQGHEYWSAVHREGTACAHYEEAKAILVKWGGLLSASEEKVAA